jgi:hypothetical protein
MLVGVPLGLSSRRGGKSAGFVITIALVFVYYFLSLTGVSLARQGKISPFLGVWAANIIFAAFGLILLRLLSRGGTAPSHSSSAAHGQRAKYRGRGCRCWTRPAAMSALDAAASLSSWTITFSANSSPPSPWCWSHS